MPRRIVISSFGSFGDVFPYIGLAIGLRERGYQPVMALPEYYRFAVEREHLEFHPVRPDIDPSDRETVRRIMDAMRGTEFIVKELILRSLRDTFEDLGRIAEGADLIITHPVTFAGPIVAASQSLPWISTVLAPMSFFSPHDLPVFPPAPWLKRFERVPGLARALVWSAKRATSSWSEPVYRLRRELGVPAGGDPIYEGQHSPILVLALFSGVLAEPLPDWPPNVRVTGAIPYNGPDAARPLPADLEEFLAAGPPPVVFTLGTSAVGAAGNFYGESIEAVRRLATRAVLLIGSHPENRPSAPIQDGVKLVEFAPHAALFPRASAIVHQGGAGTLHQALRSGRPTLVVPYSHDQPDNAHRVERLGVSRTLAPRRYVAERVERELRTILEESGYSARAEEVGRRVRAENAVAEACNAIEEVIGPAGSP